MKIYITLILCITIVLGEESHNPGQNCMDCHYDGGPGDEHVFSVGGTIYTDQEGSDYLAGANVIVEDVFSNTFLFISDYLGNFWFDLDEDNDIECNDVPMELCMIINECIWEADDQECEDNSNSSNNIPTPPFDIHVEHNGYSVSMPTYSTSGSCNSCHDTGARIHIPITQDPVFNMGDVNMDTIINVLDIIFMVNVALGTDEFDMSEFMLADCNYDGIINILDIISLVNIIIGNGNNDSNGVSYVNEIQPIFNSDCVSCHGTAGGLNLYSYEGLMSGGISGPMVVPFDHLISELWIRCASGQMPPGPNDLTFQQIGVIAQWIDEGALQYSDDCNGEYDECGICNGSGIQDGACNCNGDILDDCGICDGPGPTIECSDGTFVCSSLDCDDIVDSELEFIFSDEILVYPQENINQDFPEIISTEDGTIHLVWINNAGNGRNIMYASSSDEGETFSEPIQINQASNSIIAFNDAGPKIKVRNNELFIFYTDMRTSTMAIYMNHSTDNGLTWGEDTLISDQPYLQKFPDLEVDQYGELHLVYYSYGEDYLLHSIRYATAESNSINFSPSVAMGIVNGAQIPCECCQADLEIAENNDVYYAFRNNINNIRDHYIAIKTPGSENFDNLIQVSNHEDYIEGCPNSGPSLDINNNYIALAYRVGGNSTSYINYSNISTFDFDNEVDIVSAEQSSSPNLTDIVIHDNFIHAGWIDYVNGNPNVIYGVTQVENDELYNIQTMNQNIEVDFIMQKDTKLHWHNDKLFYFWSDRRHNNTYQLYFRKSIIN